MRIEEAVADQYLDAAPQQAGLVVSAMRRRPTFRLPESEGGAALAGAAPPLPPRLAPLSLRRRLTPVPTHRHCPCDASVQVRQMTQSRMSESDVSYIVHHLGVTTALELKSLSCTFIAFQVTNQTPL